MKSKKYSLIKEDLKRIGIGLLLALGGALIAFLTDISNLIDFSKFGEYSPYVIMLVSSVSSVFINIIRKWMTMTQY